MTVCDEVSGQSIVAPFLSICPAFRAVF